MAVSIGLVLVVAVVAWLGLCVVALAWLIVASRCDDADAAERAEIDALERALRL